MLKLRGFLSKVGIKGGIKSGGGRKEGKQETGKWWNGSNGEDRLDNNEADADTAGEGVVVVDDEEDEVADWRIESIEKAVAAALQ